MKGRQTRVMALLVGISQIFGGTVCFLGTKQMWLQFKNPIFNLVDQYLPDTVDVLDGITDLTTHLLLITLHLKGTEEEFRQ